MAQGRENAKAYLKEHPEVVLEVERQIRASHGMPAPAAADKEAP
jgi:recombination protein RecA